MSTKPPAEDVTALTAPSGVAVVRTVAPGFEPGGKVVAISRARFNGRKKAFSRAPRRAHRSNAIGCPTLESVGYGSYAGYADDD